MTMKNEVEIYLPKLFDLQSQVEADESRFKVLVCGRRWGKTTLMQFIICKALLAGKQVAYYSLTYKAIKDVFEAVLERLEPVVAKRSLQDMTLTTVDGGKLTMWSSESAHTIRGRGYDLLIVDETAFIPNLYNKWVSQLMPLLADRQGSAIFTSSPFGLNDFHRLYMLGLNGEPDWQSWRYPTGTSPRVKASELARQKSLMPERQYRQEYEAEFIEDTGAVFRGVYDVVKSPKFEPYEGTFVAGVDWGKQNDYTVISVWDKETLVEVDMDRFNQVNWSLQRSRLADMVKKWNVELVIAESNSIGEPNIEALQNEGLPVKGFATTAQSKSALIETLALGIERGELSLQDDDIATNELLAYTMTKTQTGYKYSAPQSMHDDTVIARALGYKACVQSHVKPKIYTDNPFLRRI